MLKELMMENNYAELFSGLPSRLYLRSSSQPESEKLWLKNAATLTAIAAAEQRLERMFGSGEIDGIRAYSTAAGCEVLFPQPVVNRQAVNWREGLPCPVTGLNNRCRAALDLLLMFCSLSPASRVYMTEQTTPTYEWMRQRHVNVVGSEYLGAHLPGGRIVGGLNHEDLTKLSFPDNFFDTVASFDVIEHIPDYRAAFSQIFRVLAPGGSALMTFPFNGATKTLVRAGLNSDGEIVHFESPEYHGDPVGQGQGILCFYHFGHDVLDELRQCGFVQASVIWLWSAFAANLGGLQPYILARKKF